MFGVLGRLTALFGFGVGSSKDCRGGSKVSLYSAPGSQINITHFHRLLKLKTATFKLSVLNSSEVNYNTNPKNVSTSLISKASRFARRR